MLRFYEEHPDMQHHLYSAYIFDLTPPREFIVPGRGSCGIHYDSVAVSDFCDYVKKLWPFDTAEQKHASLEAAKKADPGDEKPNLAGSSARLLVQNIYSSPMFHSTDADAELMPDAVSLASGASPSLIEEDEEQPGASSNACLK